MARDEKPPKQRVKKPKAVKLPSNTPLRVKILHLKATGEWKWAKVRDIACGICRAALEACCLNCKMPGDECPLAVGKCSHPYHEHCLMPWLEETPNCPMCRRPFEPMGD